MRIGIYRFKCQDNNPFQYWISLSEIKFNFPGDKIVQTINKPDRLAKHAQYRLYAVINNLDLMEPLNKLYESAYY